MEDQQKSGKYFDSHSTTSAKQKGCWNDDYRLTFRILKKRHLKKRIDKECGKCAFPELFHSLSPDTEPAGLDLFHERALQRCRRLRKADTKGDKEQMPFEKWTFGAVGFSHEHPPSSESGEVPCGNLPDSKA